MLYAGHLVEVEGLQVVVVFHGIEAGALFEPFGGGDAPVAIAVGREVAMAQDDGVGEEAVQVGEEGAEALALGRGAGVGGESEEVEAALVADAYGVAVVAPAVGTFLPQGTALVDLAVSGDVVVVADVLVAALQMVLAALPEGVALPGLRGRAVQDNHGDSSHGFTQRIVSHRKL